MSNRNFTGCPVEIFTAFLDEIVNSKTFEANLENSSRRLVESRGRPQDQTKTLSLTTQGSLGLSGP